MPNLEEGRIYLLLFEGGHWSLAMVTHFGYLTFKDMEKTYRSHGTEVEYQIIGGWVPGVMGRRMPKELAAIPFDQLSQDVQHTLYDNRIFEG